MNNRELAESIVRFWFEKRDEIAPIESINSKGEDGVLFELMNSDSELLAGKLAQDLNLTSGRIANILKQLENKGYISRHPGKEDRRKIYVKMTDEGRAYFKEAYQAYIDRFEKLFNKIGEVDSGELIRIINKAVS